MKRSFTYKSQMFDTAVTSVTLDKTELTLKVGNTETLTATVKPSTATDPTVTWVSSDTHVATVADGVVTPVAAGSATILCQNAGGKFATCAVRILAADADPFDGNDYCDFSSNAAKAMAGKDLLLAVWKADGSEILAIAGQRSLTINRNADTIEVTSKDTDGGWKSYISGMKEWSIDSDGVFVKNDASHDTLSAAFETGDPVCIKVYDNKNKVGMFGGLAVITEYPIEAPYDDSVTYTLTFSGNGPLVDLTRNVPSSDELPE